MYHQGYVYPSLGTPGLDNGLNIYQTKDTVRPHFLPTMPILHNILSSSSGQNNIIMSEIAINPLLLQNCNYTCKSISIYVVVVSVKYRYLREKTVLQEKFDLTINFDLMINFDFF